MPKSKHIHLKNHFKNIKKIHFIGIGGAKLSYLAYFFKRYLKKQVTGSDLEKNYFTELLKKELKIKIHIGPHKEKNLDTNSDLVIYSLAIPKNNQELKKAKKLKIKTISAPEILGIFTKYFKTISVAGSHGKGTTSALISLILKQKKLLRLAFIGTALKEFKNKNLYYNPRSKKQIFVLESDEYKGDFLNYSPEIIVLLNLDFEHPDFFKDQENQRKIFKEFLKRTKKQGKIIYNKDDKNIQKIINSKDLIHYATKNKIKLIPFSRKEKNIVKKTEKHRFLKGKKILEDYLASYKLAKLLKIPEKTIFKVFSSYKGAKRRFEIIKPKTKNQKAIIIKDYAHNPQKIKAVIEIARSLFKNKKIYIIFEPHQYQRTYYLKKELIKSLILADFIGILPIYEVKGREKKEVKQKISSKILVKELKFFKKPALYLKSYKTADLFIKKLLEKDFIILCLSAGKYEPNI